MAEINSRENQKFDPAGEHLVFFIIVCIYVCKCASRNKHA